MGKPSLSFTPGCKLIVIRFSTDAQKDLIKKSLYGHVCKLARHSVSLDCSSSRSKENNGCSRSVVECWSIVTMTSAMPPNDFKWFKSSMVENMLLSK